MTENKQNPERGEGGKKIIWFVACSGAENGSMSQAQLQKLAALKGELPKPEKDSRIICGPDEQQRQAAEFLGLFPNEYLPEYADLKTAIPLIIEELTRHADGSIIFASPKLLKIIGAVRIVDGKELPGCYGFSGSLENCALYKIFVNISSGRIEYIGRPEEKNPPWIEPGDAKPP